ncbi:carbon-nitrogen hydrolase family protein [Hoeflea prorocentri]|uniref:Carbon-nitrogen hydrolase family protein n=1 Tax=Hoeflea prorocentri TaxID=1922333 RepID=A0A9X3UIX0_9HYPH|nr:carbon-nitrogen hydrolase family protein [Hoeflea prorocentri]MCY6381431.1 carbon-nitrogen hydrolase family protein [Hoeflea prorocentri]MDA5399231.1 carbon-nitrogen hydrolase family protein [Hoeflea prorocentri]
MDHVRDKVRIASVQWQATALDASGVFQRFSGFVSAAADYSADFIVFPELFTLCLLSGEEPMDAADIARRSDAHTQAFIDHMRALAKEHEINIVAGSHLMLDEDGIARNRSFVFLRDGSLHARDKLHPTPTENDPWRVAGGNRADIVETACGPVGVMICYDSEFPELARHLIDQGARILFVPYCTDTVHGHLRVRYCCQARTVENQCYVVTSGMTGRFHNIPEQHDAYAQSAILTPSDLPFARDGIAAEATANADMIIYADLDLGALDWVRKEGAVRNLNDRRHDLYSVNWTS